MRLSQRLKNIFKTQSIILEKSPSFWLKAPKKLVITVENPQMGIDLESDDLAQKIYVITVFRHDLEDYQK